MNKQKHKVSYKQVLIFLSFISVQKISAKWASLIAYYLWFHPGRAALKHIPAYSPDNVEKHEILVADKTIRYWSAGTGPNILLVHGWASCGSQLGPIGQALLDKGYRITWFDAPAHGQSSGWKTTLFEFAESINKIQQLTGELDAVVSHSFGVPSTLMAMKHGLSTEKFVAISSPATAKELINKFCKMIKAKPQTQTYLIERIYKVFNEDIFDEIAATNLAQYANCKTLVIHDKDDHVVKLSEGTAVQEKLKSSSFIETEGLGHYRILRSPEVIQHCVDFIAD